MPQPSGRPKINNAGNAETGGLRASLAMRIIHLTEHSRAQVALTNEKTGERE